MEKLYAVLKFGNVVHVPGPNGVPWAIAYNNSINGEGLAVSADGGTHWEPYEPTGHDHHELNVFAEGAASGWFTTREEG